MFELSPTPAIASLFSPLAAPSSGASGDFAQALAALVTQRDTDPSVTPTATATPVASLLPKEVPTGLPIGRQTLADIGKTLPASSPVADPSSQGVLTPLVAPFDPALTAAGSDSAPPTDGDLPAPPARTAPQPKAARFTARSETLPIEQQIVNSASAAGETSRTKRSAADQTKDTPVDERVAAPSLVLSAPSPTPLHLPAASVIVSERQPTILAASSGATPARSVVLARIPTAGDDQVDPVTEVQADQHIATSLPIFAAPLPAPLQVAVASAITPDPESTILAKAPDASPVRSSVAVAPRDIAAKPEPFVSQLAASSRAPSLVEAGAARLTAAPSFELLSAPTLPSSVTTNGQRASALAASSQPISVQPVVQPEPTARLLPPSPAPLPTPLIGLVVPAARAFAAGIAAASVRPLRARSDDGAPAPLSAPAPAAVFEAVNAAQSDPQSTPIDMRREDWARALIDRIDASQDVANARDTRIRLVPDALGKIDVALHRQGDTLHVHFTADVPATRALLVEAQPSLAALADARGLRLGDASVDGGGLATSQGQQQGQGADQRRPQPVPGAPPSATRTNSADALAASDHRLA
ncbi:MAG: flagellar hook-length control protein FliK [Sphingomonas sp.]|nr:flagellar hook-length control protein FliK [Sphingomonas sp.]